jgi:ribose transport system permease protein
VFAHIGGRPYGMQFDKDENLIVCVGGMGVYGVKPNGGVFKVTDETSRTWTKLNDDSRVRMADDLDIAPDGKIYFSDCTTRYEAATYPLEVVEGRPNGRVLCYDPATKKTHKLIKSFYFPNGICVAHDCRSIFIASTTDCRIYRHWLAGPQSGKTEILIDEIPGHPDNINRASDGNYWLALIGVRTPSFDLSMRKAAFRRRMAKQVPPDEWLGPNLNYGCVVKFDDAGTVLESYWDPTGVSHPSVTSMREHKGYLYLGGIENNRIGRIKLDPAHCDPTWTGYEAYWADRRRA